MSGRVEGAGSAAAASPLEALRFDCEGVILAGVLHRPSTHGYASKRGVVVVVGGPQTRVGSHRQFLLLARDLAAAGHPVLRFDLRGMGDSDGEPAGFEALTPDIQAAVDAMFARVPALEEVVLWGLCDAASAIMMNAWRDPRITGVVLLNPWVRTESTHSRTIVRHYYVRRVADPAFWRGLVTGRVRVLRAAGDLLGNLVRSLGAGGNAAAGAQHPDDTGLPYPLRMRLGMERFAGRVLLVLSGNDLTAAEFRDLASEDGRWQALMSNGGWTRRDLPEANHTFSSAAWRDQVSGWTREWLAAWQPPGQSPQRTVPEGR